MKLVGRTTANSIIVEMTEDEWGEICRQASTPKVPIGERIKLYRKANRYTQQQMADLLEISRNYLSMIEKGTATNISLSIYNRSESIILGASHVRKST